MSLRRFLARAQAALRSMSREERHRRKVMAELVSPLKELSPVEAAEVRAFEADAALWRSGELPVVALPMPTVREPTAAEVFAADPLGAPLAEIDRSSPFYRSVLDGQADWMSKETVDRLESPTGTYSRSEFAAALARGER